MMHEIMFAVYSVVRNVTLFSSVYSIHIYSGWYYNIIKRRIEINDICVYKFGGIKYESIIITNNNEQSIMSD